MNRQPNEREDGIEFARGLDDDGHGPRFAVAGTIAADAQPARREFRDRLDE